MRSTRIQVRLLLGALAGLFATACASPRPATVPELFDCIRVGMSCSEVESVLGQPVDREATQSPPWRGEQEVWYLPPTALEPVESPWGPGTIRVTYSAEGRVVAKLLNPQWRESLHPRAGAPPQSNAVLRGVGG